MTFDQLDVQKQQQIILAVNVLLDNNDELPDQLTKLAEVKKTKPFVWKMALLKLQ